MKNTKSRWQLLLRKKKTNKQDVTVEGNTLSFNLVVMVSLLMWVLVVTLS